MASDHFYSQSNDHPSSLIKCPLQLPIRNFSGFLNFLPDQASLRIHLDNPCWIQLASSNPGTSSCQSGGYASQLSGFSQLAFEFVDMQITLSLALCRSFKDQLAGEFYVDEMVKVQPSC